MLFTSCRRLWMHVAAAALLVPFCRGCTTTSSSTSTTAAATTTAAAAATTTRTTASCTTTTTKTQQQLSPPSVLEQARALRPPIPNSTAEGEYEGSSFWNENAQLLELAWKEWSERKPPSLTPDHVDAQLRAAVESAWKIVTETSLSSTREDAMVEEAAVAAEERVRKLWHTVAPGVYTCQFLDPHKIVDIQRHLQSAEDSHIPTRRPNGMNRYGYILEPGIAGAVGLSSLNAFYQYLVDEYVRPLGRLLFRAHVGAQQQQQQDDVESYAFTIRYKQDQDLSLAEHSDASLYTLNINLNLPNKDDEDNQQYYGSTIYFVDDETKQKYYVTFTPGMAVLHRGMTRHAALPITHGERTNLVIWVYGQDGYVRIAPYKEDDQMTVRQRWTRVPVRIKHDRMGNGGGECEPFY